MKITIDPGSAVAPYEQVRMRIIELVGSGDLLVGTRLPTVRALADQLSIAPNTVARAYRELESAGVIETRGRNGSFIRARSDSATQRAQRLTVSHVAALRALGVDDAAIASMLRTALDTD
ncbi:GntR family transcriptional regulator [Williamsia herbipolensis]|uniref:GntR family transcriptional regulator n=1 Tax=Williamsia herbipolensis TaxID=1603258 RepID=UPI0005F7E11F|nr:GntR family transcriptional regulator [Williamsia herbipolensis]